MNAESNKKTKLVRLVTVMVIVASLSLTVVPPAQAGEFIEGNPNATIDADEVIKDDLFIAGQTVRVEGVVEGDLFAAGETVIISGVVEGNLYAAGAEVRLSGEVYGTAHLAGYAITLEDGAFIGRNVYFGGFSLAAETESFVDRSVYAGAYQVLMDGEVGRDVTAGVAAFEVNGYINGDVQVEIGEPDSNVVVGRGNWQPWMYGAPYYVEVIEPGFRVDEDAVGGEIDYRVVPYDVDIDVDVPEFEIDPVVFVANRARMRAGEFLSLLIVGGLALFLSRDWFEKIVSQLRKDTAASTGWGAAVLVGYIPVVLLGFGVLIALTVLIGLLTLGNLAGEVLSIGGLFLGGFTAVFGLLAGLASKALIGYVVGYWMLTGLMKATVETDWAHFGALALGVFLYEVLRAVPVFGWMVMIVVVVIGTGAIFLTLRDRLRPAGTAA